MDLAFDLSRFLRMPTRTTGLDIGHRNVKCVKLSKSGNQIVLDHLFMLDLAEANENYLARPMLVEKLLAASEVNGVKNAKVHFAGGDARVQMLDLNLPPMPAKERKMVINRNLEALNLKIDELVYDSTTLSDQSPPVTRIFYTSRKEAVTTVEQLIHAEFKPVQLTAPYLAMAEMLAFNGYTVANKACVLVDWGETSIGCSLIAGQDVIATHNTQTGLRLLSDTLMSAKACTYETAELAKKCLHDLKQIGDAPAEQALESAYSALLEELHAAIEYFFAQDLGVPVAQIFLTGGGSVLGHPAQLLEQQYKVPVTIVNPFKNVVTLKEDSEGVPPEVLSQLAPFMATATGLALGGLQW